MASGCRDCPACSAPVVWKLTRLALLIPFMAWMCKLVVPSCAQCGHLRGRHSNRAALG
jgi:hypothetical protein